MKQKMAVTGCVCWIAGLILFIVGLNLAGEIRSWMIIIGNIIFFAGLGIVGAVWLKNKKVGDPAGEEKEN